MRMLGGDEYVLHGIDAGVLQHSLAFTYMDIHVTISYNQRFLFGTVYSFEIRLVYRTSFIARVSRY